MKLMKGITAAVLAGIMVTGTVLVQEPAEQLYAAESTDIAESTPLVSITKEVSGDAVDVTLSWNKRQMASFNYAVVYDTSCVTVESVEVDAKFAEEYAAYVPEDGTAGYGGIQQAEDVGGYVAFGGAYEGTGTHEGAIITIHFKKVEGSEKFGTVKVVKVTSALTQGDKAGIIAATPMNAANLDSNVKKGDVNGDTRVTAVDALMALQAGSGSKTLTEEQKEAADINGDTRITAVDALMILQIGSGTLII